MRVCVYIYIYIYMYVYIYIYIYTCIPIIQHETHILTMQQHSITTKYITNISYITSVILLLHNGDYRT